MADILIVDDDHDLATMLSKQATRGGHQPSVANTLAQGVELAEQSRFDVIFLDVQMPDGNGLDFIPSFRRMPAEPEVIIITGQGDPDGAKKAITSGAWGYIEKPNILTDLNLQMTRALQYRSEKLKSLALQPVALKRQEIIGSAPALNKCLDKLASVASSDISVLLSGETGTGKEVFARAIHANSSRAEENFVVVDCASLPETLIEDTLFGHVKGAFTGALDASCGLILQADNGTLFLDEVGELPLNIQKSFLRVLQEHSFRPVGANHEQNSNFRLLAATNRDLNEMVAKGTFRKDLLYRLEAFNLHLPPLRERIEDVRALTIHFVEKLCKRYKQEFKGFGVDFDATLSAYDWPGNIRELFQVIEQAFTNAFSAPTLFPNHLPEHIRICQIRSTMYAPNKPEVPDVLPEWRLFKDKMEEEYLHKLMSLCDGNISAASRHADISRTYLHKLLNKYDRGEAA